MTTEEISKLAKTGSLPQESQLTCPERCLYSTLRNLYAEYKDKKITAEQGEQEKKAALLQYQRDAAEYMRYREQIQHHSRLWQHIELAASAYTKDPSLEHADAFLEAVYEVKRINRHHEIR